MAHGTGQGESVAIKPLFQTSGFKSTTRIRQEGRINRMVDNPKLPSVDPDAPTGSESLEALEREASKYLFGRERWQNYILKWTFPVLSALTICLTLFYLWVLADHLLSASADDIMSAPAVFLMSLVVAPILSLTTIMVFALIGVFRGYRDSDIREIPVSTIVRVAAGQDAQ